MTDESVALREAGAPVLGGRNQELSRLHVGMRRKVRTAEQILDEIATAQHGVVTRREVLAAGLMPSGIQRRVRRGTLIVQYRGVYRVGHHAPSRESSYAAAVLGGPGGSLLADRAAGHAWGLVKGAAPPPEILARTASRVRDLRSRRCRGLTAADGTTWKGIPITTVPRTLVDLAALLEPAALARACHEAGVLHRTTPGQVDAVLRRRANSPGATNLRKVLHGDEQATLSRLEAAFVSALRGAGLPLPVTNKPAGSKRVDCRWPAHRLTVELDSYRFHSSRWSWEQGYRREREARARGDEFRRYTWYDVTESPADMLAELRALLR